MSDVHEMKTLTLAGEEFNSFPDQQARGDILKKLPLPDGTAKVGQYLRVLSVDEAGKITDVETVDATPGSGGNAALSTAQIEALHGMFKVCAYNDSKDVSGAYAAFKTAFGITDESGGEEEPDTPVTPDEPEKTLSSISATYSGGDVAVGTAVSELTGIVVTAHYSDGSTETVTGYTLSGTIAEGSNTVTVSYGGKTTTFSVIGVAESGGDSGDGVSSINWLLKNDTYGADDQHDTWGDMAVEPDNGYLVKTSAADGLTGASADKACAVWPLMAGETYNIAITNSTESATFFNVFAGTLNETPVKGTISTVEGTRTKSIAAFVNCAALATNTYTYTAGSDEWLFVVPNNANRLTITAEVTA